jgi:hypothetical protein
MWTMSLCGVCGVQELKVKILVQEEGEGGGEKMVSLAIFPAKTTPIILPVHHTAQHRIINRGAWKRSPSQR